jgi:hypothetical protein
MALARALLHVQQRYFKRPDRIDFGGAFALGRHRRQPARRSLKKLRDKEDKEKKRNER